MTYITGGDIQALDYNTFATLAGGMNEVFSDIHSGATTLPNAGFGYGQTPALSAITAGTDITAAQWSSLFQTIRNCGTHQGTSVSPPVPVSGPIIGDTIVAENTGSTLASKVALLQANKFNLAIGQTTLTPGTTYTSTNNWFTLLTYSFQVNFGSWNNARYFFNSGGSLQIVGTYPTASSPIELAWRDSISAPKAPFVFNWNSTTPATGSNDAVLNPIGFWKEPTNALTTTPQIVYRKALGAGYYTSSFVEIAASLQNIAGTDGLVNFTISLVDGDPTPDIKVPGLTFTVNRAVSTGTIAYPGSYSYTSLGFTYT